MNQNKIESFRLRLCAVLNTVFVVRHYGLDTLLLTLLTLILVILRSLHTLFPMSASVEVRFTWALEV